MHRAVALPTTQLACCGRLAALMTRPALPRPALPCPALPVLSRLAAVAACNAHPAGHWHARSCGASCTALLHGRPRGTSVAGQSRVTCMHTCAWLRTACSSLHRRSAHGLAGAGPGRAQRNGRRCMCQPCYKLCTDRQCSSPRHKPMHTQHSMPQHMPQICRFAVHSTCRRHTAAALATQPAAVAMVNSSQFWSTWVNSRPLGSTLGCEALARARAGLPRHPLPAHGTHAAAVP